MIAGGVAHQIHMVIVPLADPVQRVEIGKCLLALLRQVQVDQQAAVMGARQLGPGVGQLAVHVIQLFRHVLIQGDVSRLLLVI